MNYIALIELKRVSTMVLARLLAEKIPDEQAAALVERAAAWIRDKFHPAAIWLFGSAARHEMTEFSDLDFLVLFEGREELRQARTNGIFKLSSCIGWPVDLIVMLYDTFAEKSQIGGVCQIAKEEGVCLYESKKGTNL